MKLPPFPGADTFGRNDFRSLMIFVPPPSSLGAAGGVAVSARLLFGYAENGAFDKFYCTTRAESCVAGEVSSRKYSFISENPNGVSCQSGCVVSVPVITQRMLYYQVQYLNALNQLVGSGPISVANTEPL